MSSKQIKRNITRPERAVAYVPVEDKDKKSLQERVVNCRSFCEGRGIHVARVFPGNLRKALDYCGAKKNGITMMVIPDLGCITKNYSAYSWLSAIHSHLKRGGIKLQRINYNPADEGYKGFLDVSTW